MKKLLYVFVFCCSFILNADFTGKCVGVSDGDTIKVLNGHTEEKIRLEGIDCPEISQDFGKKAKKYTSEFVFGKLVTIKEKEKDRYGRTVGTVLYEGENLNLKLLKEGLAWHYKKYSENNEYAEAEKEARKELKNLWSVKNPVAPWEYRKNGKEKAENNNVPE